MSSGEARKGALQHVQLVQNLIERCLQLYLNKKEVVNLLLTQAKINPIFTELVWQKLEEENREFFKAYHVRLMLKNQILVFNALLEKQVEHMRNSSGVASGPLSNDSTTSTLHQIPSSYLQGHASFSSRLDSVPCNRASLAMIDGSSPVHQSIQLGTNESSIAGKASTDLLSTENLNMGMPHGMDETRIKSDPGYSINSEFSFFSKVHQIPSGYLPGHTSFSSSLDSVLCNRASLAMIDGSYSGHQSIQLGTNGSAINMGMPHVMDETRIMPDPDYSNNLEFPFCSKDSNLEANLPVGDVTGGSFSISELTGQPMNEPVLDFDLSTFGGFLTQNPRNLRFTDSINGFSQSADIVDSYGGYLFLPSEANNFMDSPGGENIKNERKGY